jgi:hypothetical protein
MGSNRAGNGCKISGESSGFSTERNVAPNLYSPGWDCAFAQQMNLMCINLGAETAIHLAVFF